MDNFTISQLSQFSGIKPHTIRIWEQRYNALTPHRSKGNTRYYDGTQLRRLLNIVSLSGTGVKLSRLGALSDEELFEMIREHSENAAENKDYAYFVNQLISAGMNFDEFNFEKIFSHCLLRFGMLKTYVEVIHPLLSRIGLMWSADEIPPAHEHYISNLLRQKISTAIDSHPVEKAEKETWLLFLPEDEFHELGLLFSNYYLRSKGKKVIYLGANVPLSSVERTLEEVDVQYLLVFMVRNDLPENIKNYLDELAAVVGKRKVLITGGAIKAAGPIENKSILHITSVEDLDGELEQTYTG